jgi:hypothetical protein
MIISPEPAPSAGASSMRAKTPMHRILAARKAKADRARRRICQKITGTPPVKSKDRT